MGKIEKYLREGGRREVLAQLAKQDGVDAGHLLALAGHVLRVHLQKTCFQLSDQLCKGFLSQVELLKSLKNLLDLHLVPLDKCERIAVKYRNSVFLGAWTFVLLLTAQPDPVVPLAWKLK
jgi:hypothetical protein